MWNIVELCLTLAMAMQSSPCLVANGAQGSERTLRMTCCTSEWDRVKRTEFATGGGTLFNLGSCPCCSLQCYVCVLPAPFWQRILSKQKKTETNKKNTRTQKPTRTWQETDTPTHTKTKKPRNQKQIYRNPDREEKKTCDSPQVPAGVNPNWVEYGTKKNPAQHVRSPSR